MKLLLDEEVSIGGVILFGDTMWTDFKDGDLRAMEAARSQMNDYCLIYNPDETPFTPADSIALHKNLASKLLNWFAKSLSGSRVVISQNAPIINPDSKYKGGPLTGERVEDLSKLPRAVDRVLSKMKTQVQAF